MRILSDSHFQYTPYHYQIYTCIDKRILNLIMSEGKYL